VYPEIPLLPTGTGPAPSLVGRGRPPRRLTLLISGGPASHIPPRPLAEAARSIPHSRIVTIAAGHRVHSRRPEQFLAAVMPFLTA
jgi:pimeloyl-ACP methyl ester carboxylesterase